MKKFFLPIFFGSLVLVSFGQGKMTNKEYVERYCDIAIDKMKQYKIPASITLAQGILESGSGSSRLAVVGNNHFGIKCGKNWDGQRIYHDDDAKGECFRRYRSAEESYRDHSLFLTQNQRYASLFSLGITDYKAWARGLKAAGYATNPQYPTLLIKLIEDNRLYEYDKIGATGTRRKIDGLIGLILDNSKIESLKTIGEGSVKLKSGKLNGVKYVIARDGDTFESISLALGVSVEKLLKYNDLYNTLSLDEGDALYIKTKKSKSRSNYMHEVKKGETIHSISQVYGIQLKYLYKMNPQYTNRQPLAGAYVKLR